MFKTLRNPRRHFMKYILLANYKVWPGYCISKWYRYKSFSSFSQEIVVSFSVSNGVRLALMPIFCMRRSSLAVLSVFFVYCLWRIQSQAWGTRVIVVGKKGSAFVSLGFIGSHWASLAGVRAQQSVLSHPPGQPHQSPGTWAVEGRSMIS